MSVEYGVICACGWEFFKSQVSGDRCGNCESCIHCSAVMPPDAEAGLEWYCSPQCATDSWNEMRRDGERSIVLLSMDALAAQRRRNAARAAIFDRDNWQCPLCGNAINKGTPWPQPDSPVLDHVVPRAKAGRTTPENLRAAHAACNLQKRDLDLDVYLALVETSLRRPAFLPVQ